MINIETDSTSYQLDLDKDMALSDESLSLNLCELPRTIARYARIMGECKAYASNMKKDMEVIEARADQSIRQEARDTGDRTTEPGILKAITLIPEVSVARSAYYKADSQFIMMEGFYRALRDKTNIAVAMLYFQKEEIKHIGIG